MTKKASITVRLLLLTIPLNCLSGCVVVPRFEVTERMNFNYQPNYAAPVSEADALCQA